MAIDGEEVREGHVIAKITDAGNRESMESSMHMLKALSALETHTNPPFSSPTCTCSCHVHNYYVKCNHRPSIYIHS